MSGGGIEHQQYPALLALLDGSSTSKPDSALMNPEGKTPNQRALAVALGVTWNEVGGGGNAVLALGAAGALFDDMEKYGHQAVNAAYGNEQLAPDPHGELWLTAMAALLLNLPAYARQAAIDYFGDYLALRRMFWTPQGMFAPCARAKAVGSQPLRPSWYTDGVAVQLLETGFVVATKLKGGVAILDQALAYRKDILAAATAAGPKLAAPVTIWRVDAGTFSAAMTLETPMNDPCRWIEVVGGKITDAGRVLGDFTRPPGGVTVGVGPIPRADEPAVAPTRSSIAAEIRSLGVPKRQLKMRETAAVMVETLAPLTLGVGAAQDAVRELGISQGQKELQASIISALASMEK